GGVGQGELARVAGKYRSLSQVRGQLVAGVGLVVLLGALAGGSHARIVRAEARAVSAIWAKQGQPSGLRHCVQRRSACRRFIAQAQDNRLDVLVGIQVGNRAHRRRLVEAEEPLKGGVTSAADGPAASASRGVRTGVERVVRIAVGNSIGLQENVGVAAGLWLQAGVIGDHSERGARGGAPANGVILNDVVDLSGGRLKLRIDVVLLREPQPPRTRVALRVPTALPLRPR